MKAVATPSQAITATVVMCMTLATLPRVLLLPLRILKSTTCGGGDGVDQDGTLKVLEVLVSITRNLSGK